MPLVAGFYWLLAAAGPAPAAAAGREREQGLGRERLKPKQKCLKQLKFTNFPRSSVGNAL